MVSGRSWYCAGGAESVCSPVCSARLRFFFFDAQPRQYALLQRGEYTHAAVNIAISSVLGIVAVVLGFKQPVFFVNALILVRHSNSQPVAGVPAHDWQLSAEGENRHSTG